MAIHPPSRRLYVALVAALLGTVVPSPASADTLEVGESRRFSSLQEAVSHAQEGDVVLVFPHSDCTPYTNVALRVRTPRLTIRAAAAEGYVTLDGEGFDFSGVGGVPRAVVQFDPGADGCVLEGFELLHARNGSFNGAGVRINAANDVTVRRCRIAECDMGVMSGGSLAAGTGAGQLIEGCIITRNGTDRDPGYNHNLYLGGTSVIVRACEISWATTGHNVKSRAHSTRIEYNSIHDAAEREIDLVDEPGNTDAPGSDGVVVGNFIFKRTESGGNRGVIHFGKDGAADHTGVLALVHNTIRTPYTSPVVNLSAPGASLRFTNNLIHDGGAGQGGVLVSGLTETTDVHAAADPMARAVGHGNRWPAAFTAPASIEAGEPTAWRASLLDGSLGATSTAPIPGVKSSHSDAPAASDGEAKLLRYVSPGRTAPRDDDRSGAGSPEPAAAPPAASPAAPPAAPPAVLPAK